MKHRVQSWRDLKPCCSVRKLHPTYDSNNTNDTCIKDKVAYTYTPVRKHFLQKKNRYENYFKVRKIFVAFVKMLTLSFFLFTESSEVMKLDKAKTSRIDLNVHENAKIINLKKQYFSDYQDQSELTLIAGFMNIY